MDDENKSKREQPGADQERKGAFRRVAEFWTKLGFQNPPESDFFTFAPHLTEQPASEPHSEQTLRRRRHRRNECLIEIWTNLGTNLGTISRTKDYHRVLQRTTVWDSEYG
jgi:hypothetical protein